MCAVGVGTRPGRVFFGETRRRLYSFQAEMTGTAAEKQGGGLQNAGGALLGGA